MRELGGTVALAVAVTLLGACSEVRSSPADTPVAPIPVAAVTVGAGSVDESRRLTGTVRARHETALAFKTSGRIARMLVEEGQRVAAGQLLAKLDPTETAADAAIAQAELARAAAEAERLRQLLRNGWVTQARVEAAEAALAAARARASASAFDLQLTRVSATSEGMVLARHAEAGQIVAAGQPVVTIAETRRGWVLAVPMADTDIAALRMGQILPVRVPGLPTTVSGRVVEMAGRSDPNSGLFDVEIALPAHVALRTGLIGSVELRGAASDGRLALPPGAIFNARADEGFVYVIEAGRARLRKVTLGAFGERGIIVSRGLRAGEHIVLGGGGRLYDGAEVRVAHAG